ncbi:MAG: enoyl-CoA hydratase, partial [Acidimicrobiia bacterium]|nr:enoyl-CoA hydratase [Acidimicrobiia bacterium]
NDVLPAERFGDHVADYARLLAGVSPDSVTTAKRQLWGDLLHDDPRSSVERSKELIDEMMQRPDYLEGVKAMRDKRPPRFTR